MIYNNLKLYQEYTGYSVIVEKRKKRRIEKQEKPVRKYEEFFIQQRGI